MENETISSIHTNILKQIDKNERNYKIVFVVVALIELAFLITFILLADFTNRTHILILLSTIAIYSISIFGIVALSIFQQKLSLKIILAFEENMKLKA
jgi:hypothetical protein